MLFKPRGVTSNDPRYAGGSRLMSVSDLLAYRDTWRGRPPTESFSLAQILRDARAADCKPVVTEKLVMSENGFKVKSRDSIDSLERGVRAVQSALNKLTEWNFDVVVQTVLTPDIIINNEVVKDVVRLIYEKALMEPVFAGLYARMCFSIVRFEYEYRTKFLPGTCQVPSAVRVAIVEKCQQMFTNAVEESKQTMSEEQAERLRKRNVNNIKFAGELFLKTLITQKIIDRILNERIYEMVPNDMELEVIINLLEVVGKLYEEKNPDAQEQLWKMLSSMQENRRYSMRIRFLLQNLIDRRNGGWKPREPEQVVIEDIQSQQQPQQQSQQQQQQQQQQQSQQQPQQQQQQGQKHYSQQQRHQQSFPHHNQPQSHGGYHQHPPPPPPPPRNSEYQHTPGMKRGGSYHEVSSSLGMGGRCSQSTNDLTRGGSYNNMPPPAHGFSDSRLAPEERKRLNFARPPAQLLEEFKKNILFIVRDAAEEGMADPEGMKVQLNALVPQDSNAPISEVSVYVTLIRALMDANESERKLLLSVLQKGSFENHILTRGFSWALAKIISDRDCDDCPRIYARFAEAVWSIPSFNFRCVTKDIVSRTAIHLGALSVEYESEGEWEEDFIAVWENIVTASETGRQGESKPSVADMMESIAPSCTVPFMCNVLPDFVAVMVQARFFTEEELGAWRNKNKDNSKVFSLLEELSVIYA
ncbi:eukaryotic translation initiation factor 4 gamma, putative [Trypanosoma equiperdum]|uniref:MIF4G domain-containing protein n=2 Tax=Trypanozoon TaxID=39700 RepID=Q383M3_TRYB2|nr:hypothetical protein, conserved [Trypanosoma brucei brucei TREU927]EAN80008.1 hypothetical protein, conserved [Trypanosoma brucei brucei TREU927]SCU72802.1 eukaryotic translation initation factor 4 gamma, putative [Trypanosoma equiperdum]